MVPKFWYLQYLHHIRYKFQGKFWANFEKKLIKFYKNNFLEKMREFWGSIKESLNKLLSILGMAIFTNKGKEPNVEQVPNMEQCDISACM